MSHKLHNPKSHAPAVYIPCWLIQVSIKLLSNGAKILYGRLSQWANSNGTVYRSIPQLAEELGCSERSIEEYLRELKNVSLIGTFHPQAGGVNHYEFYDHPWMHEPIKEQLVYKQDKFNSTVYPPHDRVVPTTSSCGTPPHDRVVINNKEIKEIKCVGETPSHTQVSSLKKQKAEAKALGDEKIKNLFQEKFGGYDITIEEMFTACQEHYEQKSRWATNDKFLKWVIAEKTQNYKKIKHELIPNRIPTEEDFKKYTRGEPGYDWVGAYRKQK